MTIRHTRKIVAYLGIVFLILLSARTQAQSVLPAASRKSSSIPTLAMMWGTLSRLRWRCVALSWRFSASPRLLEILRHAPSFWTGCSVSLGGRIFQWPWAYRLMQPTSLLSGDMLRGHFSRASPPEAVDFMAEQIRRYPGQITLIAIGPLINVGALIDKDPETFGELRRVLLMGGAIYRGYGDFEYLPAHGPQPEWNILNDISSARKLLASGVPLYVMPFDSTQVQLDEVKRAILFRSGTPLTGALTLLYHEWGAQTPTLYGVMTVAYILDTKICPVQPMRIRGDDKGCTLVESGAANAQVCLHSDSDSFFRLCMELAAAPQ